MTTIKFDDNFSKNCDELMKDLPKPTTQVEEIVWHKYPEEIPDCIVGKLILGKSIFGKIYWVSRSYRLGRTPEM
ncbi:MAG: hypothetical protein WC554_00475 [Clostridia bacterium]